MARDQGSGRRAIVMVGTHFSTMGGISSVVNGYRDSGLFDRWDIQYVTTHRDGTALRKALSALSGYARFAAVVARRWPVIVHVHTSSRASFWRKVWILEICHTLSIPTILHLHGSEFMEFYEQEAGVLARWLIRRAFRHAGEVIVLSEQWRANVLRILGSRPRPLRVLRNAVAVPANLAPRPSDGPIEVVFLGRLGPRKGIFDLLDALAGLDPAAPAWILHCAGDGQVAEVGRRAAELGIADKVEVLGWVGNAERERLLRRSSIFVLPSHAEGLPMALLEAMSYGLAVVATTVGGIPEAVTSGREGYLLQPGDRNELRRCIESLLNDAQLRERMGAASRARIISEFSLQHAIEELGALYGALGARRSGQTK